MYLIIEEFKCVCHIMQCLTCDLSYDVSMNPVSRYRALNNVPKWYSSLIPIFRTNYETFISHHHFLPWKVDQIPEASSPLDTRHWGKPWPVSELHDEIPIIIQLYTAGSENLSNLPLTQIVAVHLMKELQRREAATIHTDSSLPFRREWLANN